MGSTTIDVWVRSLFDHHLAGFFLMPAARVRVPGSSPFSQLQRREKDYSDSWKDNKNIHVHWPKQWNELNKQIRKQINPPRKSASETRDPFRSQVINGAQRKEDRRREAIGFEIPVTRGAFNQGEGSTDDIKYHITMNNTGHKVLWNTGHNAQMPESWRAQAT